MVALKPGRQVASADGAPEVLKDRQHVPLCAGGQSSHVLNGAASMGGFAQSTDPEPMGQPTPSALPARIRCGYAATAPALSMNPIPVRLPPDLITWLDQTRDSEPRSTLIRQILRDEQRRRVRAEARAARHQQQAQP